MIKILVYGWYHKGNIGDDFFVESFHTLFPEYEFVFTDHIVVSQLQDIAAVFFGGGSFLGADPIIAEPALHLLKKMKVFYLGVGVESYIHPTHELLISLSQMILTRSIDQIDRLKKINPNTFFAPDLAYSLRQQVTLNTREERSVLILPNSNVVAGRMDPHWKHAAWEYFKSEFSQFLDWLIENKFSLNFFSLCQADEMHDNWASAQIVSHMFKRNNNYISVSAAKTMADVTKLVSQHSFVITQRFHGIILSEMTRTPYFSLSHHDKIQNCFPMIGKSISYYGLSKRTLIDTFNHSLEMKFDSILPIEPNIFETFSNQVKRLI